MMCSAGASIAMGVITTLMNYTANLYSGQTNKKLLNKQADAVERAAKDTAVQGRLETRKQRIKARKVASAQRQAYAGSGVDVNTGTALDVQVDTARLGEMDAQMIKNAYQNKVWGMEVDTAILRAQATAAKKLGQLGAGASLVGGGGSVADKYYQYYGNNNQQATNQGYLNNAANYQAPGKRREPNWDRNRRL